MKTTFVYGLYKKNYNYKSSNIEEGLFYVGITDNLYYRKRNHKKEKHNLHKLNLINKYDFILKVFTSFQKRADAIEYEEFLIRWFGLTTEKGILVNIVKNQEHGLQRAKKGFTKKSQKKLKKSLKKAYQNPELKRHARDVQLTMPYPDIINLIHSWAKNPLVSQQDFANKHNISRSKFKDWLRLYKPEYVGLTKKYKLLIAIQHILISYRWNKDISNKILCKKYNLSQKSLYRIYHGETSTKKHLPCIASVNNSTKKELLKLKKKIKLLQYS